jgi:hypothetical protein
MTSVKTAGSLGFTVLRLRRRSASPAALTPILRRHFLRFAFWPHEFQFPLGFFEGVGDFLSDAARPDLFA